MHTEETALKLAIEAAREAGDEIISLTKKTHSAAIEDQTKVLHEAVFASEMAIIGKIKSVFPDHDIFSEELGKHVGQSEYLWIIDPLDGTVNFLRGIREYVVSLGLEHKGNLVLGVLFDPIAGELWVARRGKGATRDGSPVHVSTLAHPSDMLLATDNSSDPEARRENFDVLVRVCNEVKHIRILGSGALQLARVSAGEVDIYYKSKFNYWDYAAGIVLVREAGGMVTDFQGRPLSGDSTSIIASNGKAHEELVAVLGKAS